MVERGSLIVAEATELTRNCKGPRSTERDGSIGAWAPNGNAAGDKSSQQGKAVDDVAPPPRIADILQPPLRPTQSDSDGCFGLLFAKPNALASILRGGKKFNIILCLEDLLQSLKYLKTTRIHPIAFICFNLDDGQSRHSRFPCECELVNPYKPPRCPYKAWCWPDLGLAFRIH
jgi:hypothetical protein